MINAAASYSYEEIKSLKRNFKEVIESFDSEQPHLYIRLENGKITTTQNKAESLSFSGITKLMDILSQNKNIRLVKNVKIKETFSVIKDKFDEKEVHGNCITRLWKNFIKKRQSKKADHILKEKFATLPFLNKDEKAAIRGYVFNDYLAVNGYLREMFNGRSEEENADKTIPQIELIRSGLEKLPNEQATLYRGAALPPDLFNELNETLSFQDPAFLSFSRKKTVASARVADNNSPLKYIKVLFITKTNQAKDISGLSFTENNEEIEAESESLFKDSHEFKVLNINKVKNRAYKWEIELETA